MTHSKEHCEAISKALSNEKCYNWKGDGVGYHALHSWVRKYLPAPELCEICNERPHTDLANITGIYNREFENWRYLCRRCHKRFDSIKMI